MITWEDIFMPKGDNESVPVTLIRVREHFNFSEDAMWAAYFDGQMDYNLRNSIDMLTRPELRAAASVCHGYCKEIRALVAEIRSLVSNLGHEKTLDSRTAGE